MDSVEPASGAETSNFDVAADDEGGVAVALRGELDIGNIGAIDTAVRPLLEPGGRRLRVDVTGVRFADSSTLAMWVRWAALAETIELHGVPPLLRRIITSMGLEPTLQVRS